MIKTDAEYGRTTDFARGWARSMQDQRARLRELGLSDKEIKIAMQPMDSFLAGLLEELREYERAHPDAPPYPWSVGSCTCADDPRKCCSHCQGIFDGTLMDGFKDG